MEQTLRNKILITNNLLEMPSVQKEVNVAIPSENDSLVATLVSNMSYYGYVPSMDVLANMKSYDSKTLKEFWKNVEPALKEVTGDNKKMDDFVVYKNFPKEVLEMSQAQYWISQILMYWGVPNQYFNQEAESRPQMLELKSLKVLGLANENSLVDIYSNLLSNPARWTDNQKEFSKALMTELKVQAIEVDNIGFKENALLLAAKAVEDKVEVKISTATDVLRLASALSDGDISLRTNVKFKKFKRSERRLMLSQLDECAHLMSDVAARPEVFKRLFQALHPGDYKFQNVINAYDSLYNKDYTTVNAEIESKINSKDVSILNLFKSRPGEFYRRFHQLYSVFKTNAVHDFMTVLPQLNTTQLVKFSKYLETINSRQQLIFAPNGNWTKAQFVENEKEKIDEVSQDLLQLSIGKILKKRLSEQFPEGVSLGEGLERVKLQTNDQELAPYGRGTEFDIPENMKFIRTASYWAVQSESYTWFDNGWNFFDKNWASLDTCCWNSPQALNQGSVFSGDPTNTKDIAGRACQMIDLYPEKLVKAGARYAVWNILAYSKMPFEKADVMGTLQWGEDAQSGKLYEPSRAQMVFPLKGDNLTKYVAYVDLVEKKLVYMDANLYGNVHSAQINGQELAKKMPAFVEYLETLPSVYDLFKHAPQGKTPILYSDKGIEIEKDSLAYVFKPENVNNQFKPLDISQVLSFEEKQAPTKKKKM